MNRLNYHHLRYFREVAHDGNLTRAAARLNLSQSALSTQIRQLEERLGQKLFERSGRRLQLTEAGGIALDHADRIFLAGEELVTVFQDREHTKRPLKVGAQSTLSRNFQLRFLRPVLDDGDSELILSSGKNTELFEALQSLALDLVLSTAVPPLDTFSDLVTHRIDEHAIGLYAVAGRLRHDSLRDLLTHEPVILPRESSIRTGFDSLTARLQVAPRIVAEVDDMAMVRLLAREGIGVAAAPAVVVADEIEQGLLTPAPFALDIRESFFAIVAKRSFPHPGVSLLVGSNAPSAWQKTEP